MGSDRSVELAEKRTTVKLIEFLLEDDADEDKSLRSTDRLMWKTAREKRYAGYRCLEDQAPTETIRLMATRLLGEVYDDKARSSEGYMSDIVDQAKQHKLPRKLQLCSANAAAADVNRSVLMAERTTQSLD